MTWKTSACLFISEPKRVFRTNGEIFKGCVDESDFAGGRAGLVREAEMRSKERAACGGEQGRGGRAAQPLCDGDEVDARGEPCVRVMYTRVLIIVRSGVLQKLAR